MRINEKLTIDSILNYIIENNLKCKLISREYRGVHAKLEFQCLCGNIYQTTFSRLKTYHNV